MTGAPVRLPTMTGGRAALLVLMDRYLAALLDPFISLLEVQRLAYFLKAAGEPIRLNYVKMSAGPCVKNLRHVLREIEGYWISAEFAEGGGAPQEQLALEPGVVQDAEVFLGNHLTTRERLNRVARLVEGFETPFGLELLATFHWVAVQEGTQKEEDVLRATYAWASRKRQFSPAQIRLAVARLRDEGWIDSAGCGRPGN